MSASADGSYSSIAPSKASVSLILNPKAEDGNDKASMPPKGPNL